MNFKSQISTTREQSQRLLALGVKPETADMILSPDDHPMCTPYSREIPGAYKRHCVPSWSLSRLLEMMPYKAGEFTFKVIYPIVGYFSSDIGYFYSEDDVFNNSVRIIDWLIERGYFNQDYLIHSNSSKTGKEDNK